MSVAFSALKSDLLSLDSTLTFGKYTGLKLAEIMYDTDYIMWLDKQNKLDKEVSEKIKHLKEKAFLDIFYSTQLEFDFFEDVPF